METFVAIQDVLNATNDLRDHIDKRLDTIGLSLVQFWALQNVADADGLSVTDLAKCLSCGRSNASQLIERMEHRHLIARRSSPTDRRLSLIVVTDNGRTRMAEAAPILRAINEDLGQQDAAASYLNAVSALIRRSGS